MTPCVKWKGLTPALYPSARLELDTQQRKLHIHLVPRTGGIGKVSVFINGKEVLEEANPVKVKGFEKMRDTADHN